MRNKQNRQTTAAFWVSLLLVIVASWAVLRNNLRTAPFHGDESNWIASAYYYTDLLLERDFTWEKWDCPACGAWGSLNLHLGKLLIGLPLKVYSETQLNGQEFTQYYSFSQPLKVNQANGRVPPGEMWLFARRMSIVYGTLTCAAAFVIGFLVADLLAGWIVVGLMLINPIFIASATRAMTDAHYNFFLLFFLLAATWFLTRPQAARWASIACGLCAGLVCSVKVTGLAITSLVFLLLVVYALLLRTVRLRKGVAYVILFTVAAAGVIYLLNPYFWPSFSGIKGDTVLAELRSLSANLDQAGLPSVEALRADFPQLAQVTRPLGFLRLFPRWNETLNIMLQAGLWKTDNRLLELHGSLARFMSSIPWLWLLVPAGLVYCAARVWRAFKNRHTSMLAIPGVYFLVNYLLIVVALKENWDRFYLPTVVAGCLLIAIVISAGLGHGIRLGRRLLSKVQST